MFLIAVSFIYIIFTSVNFGFVYSKFIALKKSDLIVNSILGLFAVTILASIWAVFGRINYEFHLVLFLLNGLIIYCYTSEIKSNYIQFYSEFKAVNRYLKFFLIATVVLIIAQAATAPYILDNESYYIQTVKWLNEYGFVKGLANLHLFLGQQSGWHITQSVFSFSFLYNEFNDLSAFCLILGNAYAVLRLHNYFENKNKNYLIFGLLPIFNILFFQFISAPSPDLPLYIFTFFLFFIFLENNAKMTIGCFNLITTLVLYMLFIKNTTIVLVLLPILILVTNFKVLAPKLGRISSVALLVFCLFILKNTIVTGTPIFPTSISYFKTFDYTVPSKIVSVYYEELKTYGFYLTSEEYKSMNAMQLFIRWLTMPKLNGLFNKMALLLLLICPLLIFRFYKKSTYGFLYLLMLLQLILLLLTSPQYRFHLNFVLFFSLVCAAIVLNKQNKLIVPILFGSAIFSAFILLVPIDLSLFSKNKFLLNTSTFNIENAIIPHKKTKLTTAFETQTVGNLKYNSPISNDFFWASGDGDLPAVNKPQIEYYEYWLKIIPQLRTDDLKNGFYAKDISEQ